MIIFSSNLFLPLWFAGVQDEFYIVVGGDAVLSDVAPRSVLILSRTTSQRQIFPNLHQMNIKQIICILFQAFWMPNRY